MNLRDLEAKFSDGDRVDRISLLERKLVGGKGKYLIKILGNSNLSKKLIVHVDRCSEGASASIISAGGQIGTVEERVSDSSTS